MVRATNLRNVTSDSGRAGIISFIGHSMDVIKPLIDAFTYYFHIVLSKWSNLSIKDWFNKFVLTIPTENYNIKFCIVPTFS